MNVKPFDVYLAYIRFGVIRVDFLAITGTGSLVALERRAPVTNYDSISIRRPFDCI